MDETFSSIAKLVIFLLLVAGGIIGDAVRKKRADTGYDDEDIEPEPEKPPRPQPQPRVTAAPPKQTAAETKSVKSNSRADDPEWLATLADRKRREAAKTAARPAPKEDDFEPDVTGILLNRLREPEQSIALSAHQAREGIILSEILGPPVSLR